MISNFPIPYQDELIYSVIARYAVHNGILSPKYLTEELFNNRNLTPTYDLPSHIDTLASYLPDQYNALTLISQHTLLPIYQIFQTDTVMRHAMQALRGEQYQSLHTKLGKNASRIKSVSFSDSVQIAGKNRWSNMEKFTGNVAGRLLDTSIVQSISNRSYEFYPLQWDRPKILFCSFECAERLFTTCI